MTVLLLALGLYVVAGAGFVLGTWFADPDSWRDEVFRSDATPTPLVIVGVAVLWPLGLYWAARERLS